MLKMLEQQIGRPSVMWLFLFVKIGFLFPVVAGIREDRSAYLLA